MKQKMNRRELLKRSALAGAGLIAAPMFNRGRYRIFADSAVEYSSRSIDLVQQSLVIDMLGPLTLDFDKQNKWFADPELNKALRASYKGSYGFREKIDIEGLNHPKRMYDLTEGLIRRKYSDAAIQGILGGNFKRVLSAIWTT